MLRCRVLVARTLATLPWPVRRHVMQRGRSVYGEGHQGQAMLTEDFTPPCRQCRHSAASGE